MLASPSSTPAAVVPEPDDLLLHLRSDSEAERKAAFAELVHQQSGRVFAIAIRMLRNEQDARDVVQETFLNVWRSLDSFRGDAPLAGWLSRIATNSALVRLRTRRRKPETSLELPGPSYAEDGHHERAIVDWSPLADEVAVNDELGRRIRDAVDALPDGYRTVLVLADYEELSMKEIADALELTVPNVKTRLHRARLAVRERLATYLAGRE